MYEGYWLPTYTCVKMSCYVTYPHIRVIACFLVSGLKCHVPLFLALHQTQQVGEWALARGEVITCCLLSQLWPAVSTTTGHWWKEHTGQDTGGCLGSGCGQ